MTEVRSLLVVDDDLAMREMLASLFQEQGFRVAQAASAGEALEALSEAEFDVVLSDIKMPGRSGIEMVADVRKLRPGTPVILMTAFGSIDSAVSAMRAGAFDYITKPFEPEVVEFTVDRAPPRGGEPTPAPGGGPDQFVGRSDRREPGHAGDLRADPQGRAQQGQRPHHG